MSDRTEMSVKERDEIQKRLGDMVQHLKPVGDMNHTSILLFAILQEVKDIKILLKDLQK